MQLRWQILIFMVSFAVGVTKATTVVTITDDPMSRVASLLIDTYDFHLAAAGRMVGSEGVSARVTSPQIGKLAHRWATATVARFEYVHAQGGRVTTTVYHAMSGREANEVLDVMPSGMSSYYPATGTAHRATIDAIESTRLGLPETGHLNDAEVKALRTMERDIVSGRLKPGGKVNAWVSQAACGSCLRVAGTFEAAYGVPVTFYQLPPAPLDDTAAAFNRLVAHRRHGALRLRQWRRAPSAALPRAVSINGCL